MPIDNISIRLFNRWGARIGSGTRCSMRMNSQPNATAETKRPTMTGDSQAKFFPPSTAPSSRLMTAIESTKAPFTSSRAGRGAPTPFRADHAITIAIRPSGMLIRKIHRHEA